MISSLHLFRMALKPGWKLVPISKMTNGARLARWLMTTSNWGVAAAHSTFSVWLEADNTLIPKLVWISYFETASMEISSSSILSRLTNPTGSVRFRSNAYEPCPGLISAAITLVLNFLAYVMAKFKAIVETPAPPVAERTPTT